MSECSTTYTATFTTGYAWHISPVGSQFSSQQLPQIVHHMATQMGVPLGRIDQVGFLVHSLGLRIWISIILPVSMGLWRLLVHRPMKSWGLIPLIRNLNLTWIMVPWLLLQDLSACQRERQLMVLLCHILQMFHTLWTFPLYRLDHMATLNTFYQPPKDSIPPQKCNYVHQLPEQIVSTWMCNSTPKV